MGRDDEDARRAARLALAVGMRRLGGYLASEITEWRREQRPLCAPSGSICRTCPGKPRGTARCRSSTCASRERENGYIPGSLFEPWHDIAALPDGLDPKRPVAVLCASGQRAAVAASLLQRYGAERVIHVVQGGVPKWGKLGEPLEQPDEVAA